MIGLWVISVAIPAGIALSALIGVWIGKALCTLSQWRDDDNESGSNPL